ncbi:hypothetical protein CLIB1444_08S03686 [[Candida] jaroonii]|uniref:Uncharacterized protein n=1 Tax=[Candida] jaroonii TaxID=467808 RepID=A0ACA9YAV8_9ASCO|nr:hypothetical protein CLIB1444_08S03686 [[Candida] jaroonii]
MQHEEYKKAYDELSKSFFRDLEKYHDIQRHGRKFGGYHGMRGYPHHYNAHYWRSGYRGGRFFVPFFGVIAGCMVYHHFAENKERRQRRRDIEDKILGKFQESND